MSAHISWVKISIGRRIDATAANFIEEILSSESIATGTENTSGAAPTGTEAAIAITMATANVPNKAQINC